ncbi:MAG: phosphate/phosphite/phosphonate ABC transporter substrate-binding protein [Candidatus Thiodiazotropha weberae]|nr:phosphate/phosphite/phosphonate ABC transporter substrate-binding protein [Candidatus Thiodiazotropha endoloripes]MCG7898320.1 phosphate/phosphite/phosphonate ABC transporter substrate-binding protein [Candidatus Thiodiazotropha weberae]
MLWLKPIGCFKLDGVKIHDSRRVLSGFAVWLFVSTITYASESLVMGVHPYRPHNELKEMFQPLADYLSMELDQKIEVRIGDSYQSHIDAILAGDVDFAYIGPSLFVSLTRTSNDIPVLARLEINGKPTFTGKIIVSDDSGINDIEDLKQRQFAFGNRSSTMSHLIPRQMLYEAGIDLDDLAGYHHYSNHNNVAMAVLAGDADAGAVKEAVFEKYRKHGIVAIETTEAVSEHLFIGTLKTDSQLLKELKMALLNLDHKNSDTASVLKPIKQTATALVQTSYQDYDALRKILNTLEQRGVMW